MHNFRKLSKREKRLVPYKLIKTTPIWNQGTKATTAHESRSLHPMETGNHKRRKYEEDHLSQLPDELIVNILSRLTLQESGRTCVLSRRWEKLWLLTNQCYGPNLVFETPIYKDLGSVRSESSVVSRKKVLYIGLLNKVLKYHQRPLLDELVIKLCMNSKYSDVIDNWIKFALAKGVERLKLDLSFDSSLVTEDMPYTFSSLHFKDGSGNHRLRALCLVGVKIDQQFVDALLCSCPLLETLSLKPENLQDIRISSVMLKHLELSGCSSPRRIEISAPNLVTFGYVGCTSALHLNCTPCLSEFDVLDMDFERPFFMKTADLPLSNYLFQLNKLKLRLSFAMFLYCGDSYPLALPELVKLEELEVKIHGIDGCSYLWPTVFIKASPFLRRFAIEISVSYGKFNYCQSEGQKRRIKEATKVRHQFLKVVEMSQFTGSSSEIELAQHLFHIGMQSLEKVVIDTRLPEVIEEAQDMKKITQSLGQGLDPSVDFVVL